MCSSKSLIFDRGDDGTLRSWHHYGKARKARWVTEFAIRDSNSCKAWSSVEIKAWWIASFSPQPGYRETVVCAWHSICCAFTKRAQRSSVLRVVGIHIAFVEAHKASACHLLHLAGVELNDRRKCYHWCPWALAWCGGRGKLESGFVQPTLSLSQ